MPEQQVTDNATKSRFELHVDGHTAFVEYRLLGDQILLTHTKVPEALGGRGIGSKLALGVFNILRQTNRKARAECTFMAAQAAKHPDLAELVES
jgi:predicted GNAT family acetyltransferase